MLWVCSTTWDEERLDIATQGLGRAKWTPEANIAIGAVNYGFCFSIFAV